MLSNEAIRRYGRQMIVPQIGRPGQESLCNASVLVIGCGGLGCPAALYLAAAGIGTIGLLDYDSVELHNLHRQILHTEDAVGRQKPESAADAISRLNSRVKCVVHCVQINSTNALEIIKAYDVVIDASDNVATRYLVNDACIILRKPLVSGSALQWEGQLTVYNYDGGPCYRCLYPQPPPAAAVSRCSENGVVGPVTGTIGALQALETIKIICRCGSVMSGRMLLFDGLAASQTTVKLRPRQPQCRCSSSSSSSSSDTQDAGGGSPASGATPHLLVDYEQFCGSAATDQPASLDVLLPHERLSPSAYKELIASVTSVNGSELGSRHLLLDTRPPTEFDICRLPGAVNIPLADMTSDVYLGEIRRHIQALDADASSVSPRRVVVVCKHGNDSQLAVRLLQDKLADTGASFIDIRGGLTAWSEQVDSSFPQY